MALITDLMPLNLQEEKEKFFHDTSYNPQFAYTRDFSNEELTKYGLPKENFFRHAQKMLETHGNYVKDDKENLSPQQVTDLAYGLFAKLSIPPLELIFTEKQAGRIILKGNTLQFRLPLLLNKEQTKNVLNHEIQTHYLRKINDKAQGLNSTVNNNEAFRRTEEGLANLHSFIQSEEKIIKKTFVNYSASYLGQKYSFSRVFQILLEHELEPDIAWNVTLKQKRGLTDTSRPGGFTKAVVYFEGIVAVWKWMQNPANNPKDLYRGRISLEALPQITEKTDLNKSIFPTFFSDMEKYRESVTKIGEENQFWLLIN